MRRTNNSSAIANRGDNDLNTETRLVVIAVRDVALRRSARTARVGRLNGAINVHAISLTLSRIARESAIDRSKCKSPPLSPFIIIPR